MTIVIIDDDEDELEYMKSAVDASYPMASCYTFNDCAKSLVVLEQMASPPDYIFLDVNMKKIDGEECLTELRKIKSLEYSRVIMISSSMRSYEAKQRRLLEKGAYSVAEKPDSLDDYGKMFWSVIGNPKDKRDISSD